MSIDIGAPLEEAQLPIYVPFEEKHFVVPGDVITEDSGYMKGHGTFADRMDRYVNIQVCSVNNALCSIHGTLQNLKNFVENCGKI